MFPKQLELLKGIKSCRRFLLELKTNPLENKAQQEFYEYEVNHFISLYTKALERLIA